MDTPSCFRTIAALFTLGVALIVFTWRVNLEPSMTGPAVGLPPATVITSTPELLSQNNTFPHDEPTSGEAKVAQVASETARKLSLSSH